MKTPRTREALWSALDKDVREAFDARAEKGVLPYKALAGFLAELNLWPEHKPLGRLGEQLWAHFNAGVGVDLMTLTVFCHALLGTVAAAGADTPIMLAPPQPEAKLRRTPSAYCLLKVTVLFSFDLFFL